MMTAEHSSVNRDAGSPVRQTDLFGLREHSPERSGDTDRKPLRRKRKQPKASSADVDTLAVAEIVREELGRLEKHLQRIESRLIELADAVTVKNVTKEYYTTAEAAKLLGKRPYTVREWCRLGRVNGEKAHSGRGLDDEWRISHDELTRIQNEGLLPLERFARVPTPKRLDQREDR